METEVAHAAMGGEFSLWNLFLMADWVVKSVMIILVLASVWSWAVMFDKSMSYGRLRRKANKFEDMFWSGKPLDDLYRKMGDRHDHPMARVFASAMEEWSRSKDIGKSEAFVIGAKDRIDKVLNVTVARELEKAESNLGVLATIGSAAPFRCEAAMGREGARGPRRPNPHQRGCPKPAGGLN